jgi:CHAD domain-containing protein
MVEPRAHRTVAPTELSASAPEAAPSRAATFAAGDPFIVFAHATLEREFAALLANRPTADRAPTPDEIHELRVAARRLRVALRLFRRMLPSKDVTRFRADLRWFASSLGDVRDLDVYTDNFKSYCAALPPEQRSELDGYQLYLRRERAEARERAKAAVAAPRTAALFHAVAAFAGRGPSAGAVRRWRSLTVADGIRDSVRRSTARVRRLGNRIGTRARATELHELRIKTKRLRYELEFFAEVYPALRQTARSCKALQDLLGAHQDACTATTRLRRYTHLLKKSGAGEPPAALAQLRQGQLKRARQVRRSFREQWQGFLALIDVARRTVA